MRQFLNHLAHYAIGFYIGWKVAQRDYAPAAFAGGFFGVYQIVEAWRKKDEGYPEIKEGGIGFALGVACYRGYAIFLRRTVLLEQANQNAKLTGTEASNGRGHARAEICKESRPKSRETVCGCAYGGACDGGIGVFGGANGGGTVVSPAQSANHPLGELRL